MMGGADSIIKFCDIMTRMAQVSLTFSLVDVMFALAMNTTNDQEGMCKA